MTKLSVLDLAPIVEGSSAGEALTNSLDLARHAEALGYNRFWLAEHHNMPGIASAATAVVIAHVAAGTKTIRVGSGGIMLPNHAPLMVAEAFGTLAELHPRRIDLGLGRAPGTDMATARALRRMMHGSADNFPQDVVELMGYFEPAADNQAVRAVPGAGAEVEVWMLGSSLFGAQLAAHLGLPYAFASHFAPGDMEGAISIYRERFRPSKRLARPYVMLGLNVIAGETDEEAKYLFTSLKQAFANLRLGRPGKMPPPVKTLELDPMIEAQLAHALSCSVVGGPEKVKAGVKAFAERTGADELMVTGSIFDHAKRVRSFEIAASAIS
ncbi:MAG: MsnO8 family LLM class oxidoreductase [Alphaproteobacteria bacterium]|nr:MsnO8 family LLM class oxidoreductase [Alphaproteobacteria bacterium]